MYVYINNSHDISVMITYITWQRRQENRRVQSASWKHQFSNNRAGETFPVAHANICCGQLCQLVARIRATNRRIRYWAEHASPRETRRERVKATTKHIHFAEVTDLKVSHNACAIIGQRRDCTVFGLDARSNITQYTSRTYVAHIYKFININNATRRGKGNTRFGNKSTVRSSI